MDLTLVSYVVLGLLGLAGVAAAFRYKFKGTSIDELRESLATANEEIGVWKGKADRLERALEIERQQIVDLGLRVTALEHENAILRGAIASGKELAPEFAQAIVKALRDHEERTMAEVRQLIADFRADVRASHLQFQRSLPPDVGKALGEAMGDG